MKPVKVERGGKISYNQMALIKFYSRWIDIYNLIADMGTLSKDHIRDAIK